ncbi:MAG: hypothetical protein ACRDLO_03375 [Solirubrobacterales bacterium]
MAWTDERLDDFAQRVEARFDAMDRRFDRVEDSIAGLGDRVHADFRDLHNLLLRIGGGMIIALIGVIAAVIGTA